MSGLFAALNASSQSLGAYQRAIDISQNNVNNASTPGYVVQLADFTALSFDPRSGLAGGVASSSSSTRDSFLEDSVRRQLTKLGTSQQQAVSLTALESSFDVTGKTGVPGALTTLFSSFSALSVSPGNSSARNAVISAAQSVATAFQQTSSAVSQASADADRQIQSQVSQINALATEISGYNPEQGQSTGNDAGRDAKLNAALEKLSSLVNISTRAGANGGTDVLIDGQIPLVLGKQQFALSASTAPAPTVTPANPNGRPPVQILDSQGRDISGYLSGGTVSGGLQFRNLTLAGLGGDRNSTGSLNTLAKGFADRVNALLTSGNISDGPPVQPGVPLFTYDSTDSTRSAASLSVVSGFTSAQIATIQPGPPSVSNGIPLLLADVASGTNTADRISGLSFSQFFGEIAAGVGSELSARTSDSEINQQSATQAQSLRAQLTGVSLDTEAVKLLQYQKAYGASAKLITILDQIAQTTLNLIP